MYIGFTNCDRNSIFKSVIYSNNKTIIFLRRFQVNGIKKLYAYNI